MYSINTAVADVDLHYIIIYINTVPLSLWLLNFFFYVLPQGKLFNYLNYNHEFQILKKVQSSFNTVLQYFTVQIAEWRQLMKLRFSDFFLFILSLIKHVSAAWQHLLLTVTDDATTTSSAVKTLGAGLYWKPVALTKKNLSSAAVTTAPPLQ